MSHLKTKFNVGDLIRYTKDNDITNVLVLRVFILDNKTYHTLLFRDLSYGTHSWSMENFELM